MSDKPNAIGVRQMRLVVTVDDYDDALHVYRDVLGLVETFASSDGEGRVAILEAGRATLELTDRRHAEHIDQLEVGRRVAGHVRVAFEVADASVATHRLQAAGARVIAEPVRTPWDSLNARLAGPGDLQLTLFAELAGKEGFEGA